MLDVAGGRAAVFGYSSDAVLTLRAAADGLPIDRLFLYEAPFRFDDEQPVPPPGFTENLQRLVDKGRAARRHDLPAAGSRLAARRGRRDPAARFFPQLEAVAQSVVHDAVITTSMSVPSPAMWVVDVPTVVMRGGRTWPRLATAADRLAATLPRATLQVLPEATDHGLEPVSIAAAIRDAA